MSDEEELHRRAAELPLALNILTAVASVADVKVMPSLPTGPVFVILAERVDTGEMRWFAAIAIDRDVAGKLAAELAEAGAEHRRHKALALADSEWRNLIWGSPAGAVYKHDGFSLLRSWRHPDY